MREYVVRPRSAGRNGDPTGIVKVNAFHSRKHPNGSCSFCRAAKRYFHWNLIQPKWWHVRAETRTNKALSVFVARGFAAVFDVRPCETNGFGATVEKRARKKNKITAADYRRNYNISGCRRLKINPIYGATTRNVKSKTGYIYICVCVCVLRYDAEAQRVV